MIHIYFKTIEGKLYTVLMDPKYSLKQLIEVVTETTGIAKEELRMVYKQRQLIDYDVDQTKTLNDVGFEDHSVIHVVKRWKKCSCVCESNVKCV